MACIFRNQWYTKAFSCRRKISAILGNKILKSGLIISQQLDLSVEPWNIYKWKMFHSKTNKQTNKKHNSSSISWLRKKELKLSPEEFSHHVIKWFLKSLLKNLAFKSSHSRQRSHFTRKHHSPGIHFWVPMEIAAVLEKTGTFIFSFHFTVK